MYSVSIDCRMQERMYPYQDIALTEVTRTLRSLPVGTVAAVHNGASDVYLLAVKRVLGDPVILVREQVPTPGKWMLADTSSMTSGRADAIRKAANR